MNSVLKIIVDLQCQVYCDYEHVGEVQPNSIFKIELRKGTYLLEFKKEDLCLSSVKYKMESNDEEDLLEMSLRDIYLYKINETQKDNHRKKSESDSGAFDLLSSIDFYDGTLYEERIYSDDRKEDSIPEVVDFIKKRRKTTFLLGKKGSFWYVFENIEHNKVNEPKNAIFSYECDAIDEFGVLATGETFAIVEVGIYKKLCIIANNEIIYESNYLMEVHSSYYELTHSKIAYNEEFYYTNRLDGDYFIAKLCNDKWQILVYASCAHYGVDIFKSPEFNYIRFINEGIVEVHMYQNGRTLYNTMSILGMTDNMHPDCTRWKVSPYEERNCNWVAVYDFETRKEGVVIEEHDKLSENEDSVYGGYDVIGKVPEEIIIPFNWDYARVFYSERNTIIAVGNKNGDKVGNYLGTTDGLKCAIMDTKERLLCNFIFDKITIGFSCQDLCFHIGEFHADVNLIKDDLIYSAPFLNYDYYDIDGRRFYGTPFKNVRLFVDTETTGLPLDENKSFENIENWPFLVQVALIIEDDNYGILAKRNIILKPDVYKIPEASIKVHGITNDMAIKEGDERNRVISFLDAVLYNSDVIIGHNVSFDLNVIKSEIVRVKGIENAMFYKKKHNIIDTMNLGTNICKIPNVSFYSHNMQPYKYPKLDELYYKLFKRHFENQHDAMADIQATYDCYYELLKNKL